MNMPQETNQKHLKHPMTDPIAPAAIWWTARKHFLYTMAAVYLVGWLATSALIGRDMRECFRMRWPENPLTAPDIGVHLFFGGGVWPIVLPSLLIAAPENNGRLCAMGGKWQR
jgi:hypothetical protein